MRTSRINPVLGLGLGLALLAVTSPRPAQAQAQPQSPSTDARWLPWLGCWQAEGSPEGSSSDAGLLCVRPASDQSSVEILRMSDTAVASHEMVWADGRQHETTRDGCTGWDEGSFSRDGQRLLLSSKYTCAGGVVRTGGGIMALVSPREWLDVRYVGMGDNQTPWVQRYRLATEEQTRAAGMGDILGDRDWSAAAARTAAASPPTVDDVIEASKAEPAEVVQAWLAERRAPLKLDAKALERMADAGVPPSVTDMAVAVSYPDHFRVDTQPPREAEGTRYGRGWSPSFYNQYYDPFYGMYGFSPFGYAFSPYGYFGYSPFGYSPFGYGYGYGGGYYGGYGYGYTPIITITNTNQPSQHGRMIAGRGYTRGGYSGTGGSASSAAPARSSTSGSSATAPPASTGSSTGRTAHRRGGGGGGGL